MAFARTCGGRPQKLAFMRNLAMLFRKFRLKADHANVQRHREAALAGVAIQSGIGDLALDCIAEFTPRNDIWNCINHSTGGAE